MKVTSAKGTRGETSSEIDLFDDISADVKPSVAREINKKAGEFILEQIAIGLSQGKSIVEGEDFPRKLSKTYKDKKVKEGGEGFANMELTGDMLDSLEVKATSGTLKVGFFDSEAWKADGHNKFSGKEGTAPRRRFLPGEGQQFKPAIQREIDSIVADEILNGIDPSEFKDASSKTDLLRSLSEMFPDGTSLGRIKSAIARNEDWTDFFEDL